MFQAVLSALSGGLVKEVRGIVDDLHTSDEEKQQAALAMENVVTSRLSQVNDLYASELEASKEIIVAEMKSGDDYTKRTRPFLVRFGLYIIAYNYAVVPTLKGLGVTVAVIVGGEEGTNIAEALSALVQFDLPTAFWTAWGGCVSVWFAGRSLERGGAVNGIIGKIAGHAKL